MDATRVTRDWTFKIWGVNAIAIAITITITIVSSNQAANFISPRSKLNEYCEQFKFVRLQLSDTLQINNAKPPSANAGVVRIERLGKQLHGLSYRRLGGRPAKNNWVHTSISRRHTTAVQSPLLPNASLKLARSVRK
jgi:hypothetical protein